jgi:hypothetical protein
MESWTEERARLVRLISAIEAGNVTHIDNADARELQATTEANIAGLKARLAELDSRLGTND